LAVSVAAHASLATESNVKRWKVVMAEEVSNAEREGWPEDMGGAV
jgi:hypothetical protein